MIAGVAKALAASANTMIAPESMPGIACGSTTRRSTVQCEAPSDIAAFSICGSSRCSAAHTDSTMKGTSTCASAITTPVSVNMNGIGEWMSPSLRRAWLMTPVSPPKSSAHPSVRATTEMSSGPRITSRKKPRQRGAMRLRI